MPERQSSTGEETGRPTAESAGTSGASAGRGPAAGPPDGSAPVGDGPTNGSAATAGGAGTNGAGPVRSGSDGAPGSPATNGAGTGGTTNGSATADGAGTDATAAPSTGSADGGATAGSSVDDTVAGGPATSGGDSATTTGAPATGAAASGAAAEGAPPEGAAAAGTTANGAAAGTGTGGAPATGAAADAAGSTPATTDTGTGTDSAGTTDAGSGGTGSGGTGSNGTGSNGTGSNGTGTTGAATGRASTGGAATSPAPVDATSAPDPARDTAADGTGDAERTSLFEPARQPPKAAAARPAGSAAASSRVAPAPDDATSTVAIPGRTSEAIRSAAEDTRSAPRAEQPGGHDDTVRVALPAPAAGEAPTRPTPAPGGAAATRAVPVSTSDAETTQVIPLSTVAPHPSTPPTPYDPPTQRLEVRPAGAPPAPVRVPARPDGDTAAGGGGGRSRRRRPLLVTAAVLALLGLLYVADLVASAGSVPRGTTVAGLDVGGLSLADAEQELRTAIEPRSTRPVPVVAGTVTSEIDPVAAGLAVDWDGTLAQAGDQPLNPITRITSFFTTSNVLGVVTTADDQALTTAIQQLAPVVDTEPVEGTVRFEGTVPVPVDPVPGQRLDGPAAVDVVKSDWASGRPVALPLTELPARTTAEDVATAVADVAAPAVSGPVTVVGEDDTEGVLEPETIAEALSFEPGETGGLNPVLNPTVITDALEDQLADSEQEARNADLDFSATPPTIIPSQDGRGVDYEATLAALLPVLAEDGDREITAVYADQPADVTTAELEALGTAGEISRFTTRGFAQDSGINIRRAAELVDGTIVGSGETFSLDAVTGPRTAANGYVEAGVIENGRAGRGIAGGVSQVATTTYNAAYLAGMTDVEHRPHSFYISRYPEGREATIVTGALDMRFRNDTPTAVLIRTVWTPTDITVIFYGTKYFEVTGETSPRTAFTEPNTVVVPEGEQCSPSQGSQGFTVTDTRTLRNLVTGEVTTETQTTRYNPAPRVVCGGD
jgi:vancomycin resistance protein YoaR